MSEKEKPPVKREEDEDKIKTPPEEKRKISEIEEPEEPERERLI